MSNKVLDVLKRNLEPLLIFVLALLVTLVCWRVADNRAQAEQQQAFVRATELYRHVLERRIEAYVNFLTDLSSLFTTDDDEQVSAREFASFIANANVMTSYPGTNRIGYLPRVPASQKAAHEARMRAAGFPDYKIQASGQPEYYPYTYLYPLDAHVQRILLGVDPHQQPSRHAAMQQARDQGAVMASSKLEKLVYPSTESSFLFFAPIYRRDMPRRTVAERRQALEGYVFAAFRADKLLQGAWGNDLNRIASVRFLDGDHATGNLLYDSDAAKGIKNDCARCLTHVETISAAGRQWSLAFHARPAFYQANEQQLPALVLAGGLVTSLLLAGIALQRNRQRRLARVQQEQDQQFRSLFDQNPDAVYSLGSDGYFINANAATLALTGVASLDTLKTIHFRQLVVPEDQSVAMARFELASRGTPCHGEVNIIDQAGKRIALGTTSLPILINGQVAGVFGIAKDITFQKKAEAQTRQMRQFLDAVIDNLPVAIFAKEGKDLRFITWNKGNEKIIGIPHDEVMGKNDYELFPKAEADYFTAVDRGVLERWEPLDIPEEAVQTRNKGIRLLHTRKVPFRMGDEAYLLGISEDITDSRRAARELHETKQMLEKVLNNIPQRVFWKDLDLVYLGGNQPWRQDAGIADPVGRTDFDMPWQGQAEQFRADDREVMRKDQAKINYEESLIRPDGRITWLRTSKIPLHDQAGKVIGVLGTYEDITLQKQAEDALHRAHAQLEERVLERTAELRREIEIRKETEKALRESQATLQKVIETMPVGIWIADRSGRIIAVNPEAHRIWGHVELVGLAQYDLYKGWDPKTGRRMAAEDWFLGRAVLQGQTTREEVVEIEAADGARKKVLMSAYPLLDESRQVIGAICLNQDITERMQREEEFRLLSGHLQTIREDERTRIAREIHDELGGVLTAVKFDLSTFSREGDQDKTGVNRRNQETLKLVDNAIVALRRIMSDLRPSVLDDLGLWAALEWLAMEFETRMGIPTRFKLNGEEVEIEPNRATALFRMTQESLNNVAKHAHATRVTITATTKDQDLLIRIRDNGCGISQDDLAHAKSFGIKGMNERARTFSGAVKVSGRPGQGTTVSIRFPIRGTAAG